MLQMGMFGDNIDMHQSVYYFFYFSFFVMNIQWVWQVGRLIDCCFTFSVERN